MVRTRASALIDRIAAPRRGGDRPACCDETLQRFGGRHHDLEATFRHHYDLVHHRVARASDLSPTARLLVGAYFSHEYAVEAAALCNPSMVAHPDQSDLDSGQLRVAISLRQIGEGHMSSIGFATAVLGPDDRTRPSPTGPDRWSPASAAAPATGATCSPPASPKTAGTTRSPPPCWGRCPNASTTTTSSGCWAASPPTCSAAATTQSTLEQLRRTTAASYAVTFPADVPLDQRVLWPATPPESNGMEDARFVRFVDDDGEPTYHATYTAYDGRHIAARMLSTGDLRHFEVTADARARRPATRAWRCSRERSAAATSRCAAPTARPSA